MNKIIKIPNTSSNELINELLSEEFSELYAIGIKIVDEERQIFWYSSGNESRLKSIGVLEYLKNKLLNDDE